MPHLNCSKAMNHLFLFILIFYFLLINVNCLNWLVLSFSGTQIDRSHPRSSCRNLLGMNRKQMRFCRKNIEQMESIRAGTQAAYRECQFQFHTRRWNCSIIDPVTKLVFGYVVLEEGTREAAFLHAISAAGVAYQVTKDCSKGLIDKCGCDQSVLSKKKDKFIWNGCSDNVRYGIAVSRSFVDLSEKGRNESTQRRIMNLHNNNAGRQVLEANMRRECKCHGLSGSCDMKTCWTTLPTFREIGAIIKDKFDGAAEVDIVEEDGKSVMVRKNTQFKRHTETDLVYLDSSPDYCDPDPEKGVLGTHGRLCNVSSYGIDGCELLCCYRGYEMRVRRITDRCNCKFFYCCRVECQMCTRTVEDSICK